MANLVQQPRPGSVACATPISAAFVVRSLSSDETTTVHASLAVEGESAYMQGHFPSFTIFPGVFMLELAMRAVLAELDLGPVVARNVLHVRTMRFVAPLLDGDTVTMVAEVTRGDEVVVDARFRGDDNREAARIEFALRSAHGRDR